MQSDKCIKCHSQIYNENHCYCYDCRLVLKKNTFVDFALRGKSMKAEQIKKEAIQFLENIKEEEVNLLVPNESANIEQALKYLHERKKVEDEVFKIFGK